VTTATLLRKSIESSFQREEVVAEAILAPDRGTTGAGARWAATN